jgi:hypothetical protein
VATIAFVPAQTPTYEIRLRGFLSDAVLACFDDTGSEVADGNTVLRARVTDQVRLHGLLDRIQSLGLEILELRRLPPSASGARRSTR